METSELLLALTSEGVYRALNDAGLESLWSRIEQQLLPGVAVTTLPATVGTIPVGASKFGGLPDLPVGEPWPTSPKGMLLSFLGQYDLAQIAALLPADKNPLPKEGLLSFFYFDDFYQRDNPRCTATGEYEPPGRGEEESCISVRYFPTTENLQRVMLPTPLLTPYTEVQLDLTAIVTPPGFTETTTLLFDSDDAEESFAYEEMSLLEEHMYSDYHQLLGHETGWAGDDAVLYALAAERGIDLGENWREQILPEDPRNREALLEKLQTWRHLATFKFDSTLNWWWGKGGSLVLVVPEADLRRGDFRRVYLSNPFV